MPTLHEDHRHFSPASRTHMKGSSWYVIHRTGII